MLPRSYESDHLEERNMGTPTQNLQPEIQAAVRSFWASRSGQQKAQKERGGSDQGRRGSATGGKHLDGFLDLFADLLRSAGIPDKYIYLRGKRDLPGFFRPG